MVENSVKNNEMDVKARLLDAGEAIFADEGFNNVSVRQLTKAANCNVAAINYYYGGKYELYTEVVRQLVRHFRDIRIKRVAEVIDSRGDELTLKELVMAFSSAFVEPLLHDSHGRKFFKIVSWEMIKPIIPKQMLIDEMIRPVVQQMMDALINLIPNLSTEQVLLSIESLVGQLMHTIHINECLKNEAIDLFFVKDLNVVVEHIVKFSVAGIRAYAIESENEK